MQLTISFLLLAIFSQLIVIANSAHTPNTFLTKGDDVVSDSWYLTLVYTLDLALQRVFDFLRT